MDPRIELEKAKERISQLGKKQEQLEQILNSSFDGIYVTDGQGNIIYVNEAIGRIYRLESQALVGKNVRELKAQGLFTGSGALQVLLNGDLATTFENVASGIALSTGSPVFDNVGNMIMVVNNVRAVNEVHRLREELTISLELNQRYHSEVASLRLKQIKEEEIVTCSKSMFEILDLVSKVANLDTTVLILGESGVGKEVVARMIHRYSKESRKQSFIKINCGAIPRDLLESELFGYEAGAFTGANKQGKPGMFELADKGTMFLDEIAELPLDLQVKLLRVLQENEIVRLGGTKPLKVDVRIIAATNKDLALAVQDGTFRDDLFYRLNVIPMKIPPLRERKEDIPLIANHFLRKFSDKYNRRLSLTHKTVEIMLNYHWPGNVRELRNLMERLAITVDENIILPRHLPEDMTKLAFASNESVTIEPLKKALEEVEKSLVLKAMQIYKSTYAAAEALGISQPTMFRKVKKYGGQFTDEL